MIGALINLIVWLLIIGVLWYLVIYVLDAVPVPDPPARLIKVAVTVIMCLVLLMVVLSIFGINTGTGFNVPKLAG
jgi:hypothetical protein